jgi:ribose 5-phosphate isomerase B
LNSSRFFAIRESTVEQPAAISTHAAVAQRRSFVFMTGNLFAEPKRGGNNDTSSHAGVPRPGLQLTEMPSTFTIALGSDHAGFDYKEAIKAMLLEEGHTIRDFGTYSDAACDYPDFIRPVAQAVARGEFERGIVLGGSGNGEAIVANRIRGIRCGVCWSERLAIWNRAHNDGNVLSIGQRTVSKDEALAIARIWLATRFEGGRHLVRINKIDAEA